MTYRTKQNKNLREKLYKINKKYT